MDGENGTIDQVVDITERIKQVEQDKMRADLMILFDKEAPETVFPVLGVDSREKVLDNLSQIFFNGYSADALAGFLKEIRIQLSQCPEVPTDAEKERVVDALMKTALDFREYLVKKNPATSHENAIIYSLNPKK